MSLMPYSLMPWFPTYPTCSEVVGESCCCTLMFQVATYGVRRFRLTARMSQGLRSQRMAALKTGPATDQFRVLCVVAAAAIVPPLPNRFEPVAPVGMTFSPGVVALLTPF